MKDEALKLIERLVNEADLCRNDGANDIAALLDEAAKALAAPVQQEPVAEVVWGAKTDFEWQFKMLAELVCVEDVPVKLYAGPFKGAALYWHDTKTDKGTTPPAQRKPLTDEDAAFKDYLKDCDEHAINPDVGSAFHFAWQAAPRAAQPAPVQEPLFWYRPCRDGMYEGPVHNNSVGGKMLRDEKPDEWKPLYTTPPAAAQRKPLTDAEIQAIHDTYYRRMGPQEFARAIEAAHGIKENT